jgi:NADH-quinone oxidoreductase subunit F
MVDVAKYFMSFLKDESCGKCFPCRKGTQRMYEILEKITEGRGTMEDLDLLEELAHVVKDSTMCGLGQSASNPVLSTLAYFREEYVRHIKDKRCDASVCSQLVGAPCASACPLGTEAWRYVAHIARNEYEDAYRVIREANPFPSVCARICDHPCEAKCRAGTTGGSPVAIRALKRFVTDRVDPAIYTPERTAWKNGKPPRAAVVGSGPAGMAAAHYLSLKGVKVTIFESEEKPGGMLTCVIPSYRLPREVIEKEIASIMNENVKLECNKTLGKDMTMETLFEDGYQAVLLAMGAHKSKALKLKNEHIDGVYASIEFLKRFNLKGSAMAKGRVGVIGGGNAAIDAARTAIRQKDVESVTVLYRRSREEMPAYDEEIEAAEQEGIEIKTLLTPGKIISANGRISGLQFIRNRLGEVDASGRRRPVPIEGTEHQIDMDTLVVAISEDSGIDCIGPAKSSGIETTKWGTIKIDPATLQTSRPGVFAAGDLVTGPNTVVEAIAAGKKAAVMIERYLLDMPLVQPAEVILPEAFVEPVEVDSEALMKLQRAETPRAPAAWRKRNFAEVEVSLSADEAVKEASRCMRCDLEFTQPEIEEKGIEKPDAEIEPLDIKDGQNTLQIGEARHG